MRARLQSQPRTRDASPVLRANAAHVSFVERQMRERGGARPEGANEAVLEKRSSERVMQSADSAAPVSRIRSGLSSSEQNPRCKRHSKHCRCPLASVFASMVEGLTAVESGFERARPPMRSTRR